VAEIQSYHCFCFAASICSICIEQEFDYSLLGAMASRDWNVVV